MVVNEHRSEEDLDLHDELRELLGDYLRRIEALCAAAVHTAPLLSLLRHAAVQELPSEEGSDHVEQLIAAAPEDEEGHLAANDAARIAALLHDTELKIRTVKRSDGAMQALLDSLLVSLPSLFDGFMEQWLALVFLARPEAMKGIACDTDLGAVASLRDARKMMRELARSAAVRFCNKQSYNAVTAVFEKHNIGDVPRLLGAEWAWFVETYERRHVLVHRRGLVDQQYLDKVKAVNNPAGATKADQLHVDVGHLHRSALSFYSVACMVSVSTWVGIVPAESSVHPAYAFIVDESMRLLDEDLHGFARALLLSTEPVRTNAPPEVRANATLNLAWALKLGNRLEDARTRLNMLDDLDRSALYPRHELARAAVEGDYRRAAELLATCCDLSEAELLDWPIFAGFRQQPLFVEAFAKRFGRSPHEAMVRHAARAESGGGTP